MPSDHTERLEPPALKRLASEGGAAAGEVVGGCDAAPSGAASGARQQEGLLPHRDLRGSGRSTSDSRSSTGLLVAGHRGVPGLHTTSGLADLAEGARCDDVAARARGPPAPLRSRHPAKQPPVAPMWGFGAGAGRHGHWHPAAGRQRSPRLRPPSGLRCRTWAWGGCARSGSNGPHQRGRAAN